nr:hypothetical protein GCM10020185_53670 [Pseudomonas brassicacearum subsp. brassicacearum]
MCGKTGNRPGKKQILARQHLGRIHLAPGRYGEVAAIEQHQSQDVVADFRFATGAISAGRALAVDLALGAIVEGPQACRQAHVAGERVDVLLVEVGLSGLPAEPSQDGFLLGIVPNLVGTPGDAVFFSRAWASAFARMASSGMASSSPRPIIGGATRAEKNACPGASVHRPVG